jgi:nucleoid-associated protein YgaU
MDELQRYGLLSLACLVVLCLALTFKDRDIAPGRPELAANAKQMSISEAGENEVAPRGGDSAIPAPGADVSERPDDVPLRPTPKSGQADADAAKAAKENKDAAKPVAIEGAADPGRYKIAAKDTLRGIAKAKLGNEKRWTEIVAVNPGLKPDALKVGQEIKLPPREGPATVAAAEEAAKKQPNPAVAAAAKPAAPKPKPTIPKTHKVAKGETLSAIARRYYDDALAWKKIYKANKSKMKNAQDVREGLVLSLP